MDDKTYENVAMRREAGAVKRWHIVPTVGTETVGHHTYNAVSLLLCLNSGASRALIVYMLEHDVTERWTGDIPASAKGMFPTIGQGVKQAEIDLIDEMELMCPSGLTPSEKHWARAIDALDAVLFCSEQLAMGNRMVENALESLMHWLMSNGTVPGAVVDFVQNYEWKRYPDYLWKGHYGDNE